MFVGIDLGQRRVHVVGLNEKLALVAAHVIDVDEMESLEPLLQQAQVVAIDAPEALSTGPHSDDVALGNKFRSARCAEVSLGREHAVWVPWVTPTADQPLPAWMSVGFQVFELVKSRGVRAIEVFPYAGFRTLAGRRIPSKQTAKGLRVRAHLLGESGVRVEALDMWSHDSLDAGLAALVARQASEGHAQRVGCGHDESAIFLPRVVGIPADS